MSLKRKQADADALSITSLPAFGVADSGSRCHRRPVAQPLTPLEEAQAECIAWEGRIRRLTAVLAAAPVNGAPESVETMRVALASYRRSLGDANLRLAVVQAELNGN